MWHKEISMEISEIIRMEENTVALAMTNLIFAPFGVKRLFWKFLSFLNVHSKNHDI